MGFKNVYANDGFLLQDKPRQTLHQKSKLLQKLRQIVPYTHSAKNVYALQYNVLLFLEQKLPAELVMQYIRIMHQRKRETHTNSYNTTIISSFFHK